MADLEQSTGVDRQLTRVFQLMGSTKLLITSASISALTLARPTIDGSRAIQFSHSKHWSIRAGRGFLQLFAEYEFEQSAISCRLSDIHMQDQWQYIRLA